MNQDDELDNDELYDFEVSDLITEARIYAGITQEELARRIHTALPNIKRAENGAELPSHELLKQIAKAVGLKLLPPRFEMNEPVLKVDMKNTSTATIIDEKKL